MGSLHPPHAVVVTATPVASSAAPSRRLLASKPTPQTVTVNAPADGSAPLATFQLLKFGEGIEWKFDLYGERTGCCERLLASRQVACCPGHAPALLHALLRGATGAGSTSALGSNAAQQASTLTAPARPSPLPTSSCERPSE